MYIIKVGLHKVSRFLVIFSKVIEEKPLGVSSNPPLVKERVKKPKLKLFFEILRFQFNLSAAIVLINSQSLLVLVEVARKI